MVTKTIVAATAAVTKITTGVVADTRITAEVAVVTRIIVAAVVVVIKINSEGAIEMTRQIIVVGVETGVEVEGATTPQGINSDKIVSF